MLCQNNKKEAEDIKLNNETTKPRLLMGIMTPNRSKYNIFIRTTLFNPVLNNNMMRYLFSARDRAGSIMFSYIYICLNFLLLNDTLTYICMPLTNVFGIMIVFFSKITYKWNQDGGCRSLV